MNQHFGWTHWRKAWLALLCLFAAGRAAGPPATYSYDGAGNVVGALPSASDAPVILAPPQPELMDSNSLAIFSVRAAGRGLTYQWLSNGIPIAGAKGDSLVVANLPLVGTNLGNFSVIVSNPFGSITSPRAALWPDANGNSIPDWWELRFLGNLGQRALADNDRDGVANRDEYLEDTNPTNRLSFNPRLSIRAPRGRVIVSPSKRYYALGQLVSLTAIPDPGESFVSWSGAVTGNKPTASLFMNTNLTVVANFGFPLGVALDNTNVVWTTTGNALWFGQSEVSVDGMGAAQSGPIVSYWDGSNFVGDRTSLQTTLFIAQPQQLGFWWAVSSQPPDNISFFVNANLAGKLSGQFGGWQRFQTNLPAGVYTLAWTYSKGPANIPDSILYQDAAWVDQVTLVGATPATIPSLAVQKTGSNTILLTWPVGSDVFRLQHSSALAPILWSDTTDPVSIVNGLNQVSVVAADSSEFYRLVYP